MKNPILYDAAAQALTFAFNFAATTSVSFPEMKVEVANSDVDMNNSKIIISGLNREGITRGLFEDSLLSILRTLADTEILDESFQASQVTNELATALFGGDGKRSSFTSILVNSDRDIELHTEKTAAEIVDLLNQDIPDYARARANQAANTARLSK